MESVTVYSIENDVASKEPIIEELTGTDQLYEIENTAEIAVIRELLGQVDTLAVGRGDA